MIRCSVLIFLATVFSFQGVMGTEVSFIAFGDVPYRLSEAPLDYEGLKALRTTINSLKPDFSVHVGDIIGGSSTCNDELITTIYQMLQDFENPLIYTPGDNEWTDCHRESSGKKDPLKRLAFLRQLFFSKPRTLGRNSFPVEAQSFQSNYSKFVENLTWSKGNILFSTVHIVGSNNNRDEGNISALAEFDERNKANLFWIKYIFETAITQNSQVLVLFFHADMRYQKKRLKRTGYNDLIDLIREQALAFSKPILMVHGDSHRFIIDNPVTAKDKASGREVTVGLLTRLEVHGAPDVSGVEVRINSSDPQPFAFRPLPLYKKIKNRKAL